jgi:selenocysteine lyase/cysteine desulfurase
VLLRPGGGEAAFSLAAETLLGTRFDGDGALDDYLRAIGMASGGAVRVSLGVATNFADVYRFMHVATAFVDLTDVPTDLPPRVGC